MDAMISRDAHRSHQFAVHRAYRSSVRCTRLALARPFLSFSFSPSFSLSTYSPRWSPWSHLVRRWFPCIAFRGQFNRSCAAECAKWSCVLGDKWDTSFLSIGHLPADEFIRSRVHNPAEPADRIRRDGEVPATGLHSRYICVYTRGEAEAPRAIATGDLAGPRASYRSTRSVAAEIITGVATLRLSDVWFYLWPTLP